MRYEYQSFDDMKLAEIKGDKKLTEGMADTYLEAVRNPDLNEFLHHQRTQYQRALEADVVDRRWESLFDHTNHAEQSLKTGEFSRIASAFFELGEAVERLNHPGSDEMIEFYAAMMEKMDRERPLHTRNSEIRFLKGCSEVIAKRIWRNDTEKKIKITEACELVWSELVDVAMQYDKCHALPDGASSLKDWLRPIAPEYARKGGRPKKVKK